jgi:hypothetical protein
MALNPRTGFRIGFTKVFTSAFDIRYSIFCGSLFNASAQVT